MSDLDRVLAAAGTDPGYAALAYDGDDSPAMLVQAADAALDESCRLFKAGDISGLSPEMQQAVYLAWASRVSLAGALAAMGEKDPDEGMTGYTQSAWVERTAFDRSLVGLASDGKKPYGDVTYADPGYQSDGKKRYPVDTEDHVRAAWSYINKGKNSGAYSAGQLASIKGRIKSAAKEFGVEISDSSGGDS